MQKVREVKSPSAQSPFERRVLSRKQLPKTQSNLLSCSKVGKSESLSYQSIDFKKTEIAMDKKESDETGKPADLCVASSH